MSKSLYVITPIALLLGLMLAPIGVQEYVPHADKVAHFVACAFFTYAFTRAFSLRKAVFLALVLGLGIEYVQYFIKNRTPSLDDAIANTCGVLFVWLVFYLRKRNA